jgi:hypothetical protein
MISKTLSQIVGRLNDYLGSILDPNLSSYEDKYAIVGHLQKDSLGGSSKRIIVNLINIEEDKVYKNHLTPLPSGNTSNSIHPLGGISSMRINVYLIFAFSPGNTPEQYVNSLTLLTHVLRHFQGAQYQQITIPGSVAGVTPVIAPKTFDLEICYHNISLEDSNNMWSNLGGEQKPYAMYQIKMLEIEPIFPDELSPILNETHISNPEFDSNGKIQYDANGATINDTNTIQHKNNN